MLTHLPLVPHICVSELVQYWFRQWLVACSAPSHYLNQFWRIVNWTRGNKFHGNSNRNSIIFIQENVFKLSSARMAALLSRRRWAKEGQLRSWHTFASFVYELYWTHYSDVTMSILASQITCDSTVCLCVCLDEHKRKHQSPCYWPFVRGIHHTPVNSPHKGPVTRKSFPFDDVIMIEHRSENWLIIPFVGAWRLLGTMASGNNYWSFVIIESLQSNVC